MIYYKLIDQGMGIHHGMVCMGMYMCLSFDESSPEILAGCFIAEISNPVMHLRMIAKDFGRRHTLVYEVSEMMYYVLYIYGRIIMGTGIVYRTCTTWNAHPVIRFIAFGIALQSYFYISR